MSTNSNPSQNNNNGQWAKWLGAGVAALLVALLFRGCDQWGQNVQVPKVADPVVKTVAPAAPAAAAPVPTKALALAGAYVNGKFTLNGAVPSEAIKAQIDAELKKVFGEGNYVNNLTVSADVKPANWLGKMSGLFDFFKLPGSEVNFNDNVITLSGTAGTLKDKVQALVGEGTTVNALDLAAAAHAANGSALEALNALKADASGADILKAMGLQIINFASGSTAIPAENQAILKKGAELLKTKADFKFEIGGHADNKGKADTNLALSGKRAQAVRDFLVKNGVTTGNLTAKGYGDTKPVAENSTEAGRLKNRRIEYTAAQ